MLTVAMLLPLCKVYLAVGMKISLGQRTSGDVSSNYSRSIVSHFLAVLKILLPN